MMSRANSEFSYRASEKDIASLILLMELDGLDTKRVGRRFSFVQYWCIIKEVNSHAESSK